MGELNFFSGRGVWPGFLKCGACKLIISSERGSYELKMSKFEGFRPKLLAKIEVSSPYLLSSFERLCKRRKYEEVDVNTKTLPLKCIVTA